MNHTHRPWHRRNVGVAKTAEALYIDMVRGSIWFQWELYPEEPTPTVFQCLWLSSRYALLLTCSGESFPSAATILLRQATDPNRGTASVTLRYLCPLLVNTRITCSSLNQMKRQSGTYERYVFSFNCPFWLQSTPTRRDKIIVSWINQNILTLIIDH